MASACPSPLNRPDGELYMTVSLLIERERLGKLATAFDNTRNHEGLSNIEEAIDPMFQDIADRKRQIFFDERLVDTRFVAGNQDRRLGNSSLKIALEVPRTIKWRAEDQDWQYDAGASWNWKNITCRFFWYIHSNQDVSYHISLHVPYYHDAKYYYALSLLQKLFFPSETPDAAVAAPSSFKVIADDASLAEASAGDEFIEFLSKKFNQHVDALPGSTLPEPKGGWWQELVLAKQRSDEDGPPGPTFSRAAMLFKDTLFDRILRKPEAAICCLKKNLTTSAPAVQTTPNTDPPSLHCRNVNTHKLTKNALALIFLSGFLQNIIDFLEQDDLEYSDAIEPLYPAPGTKEDPHFLLYATQDSVFEIVSASRSLDRGGDYIGLCPYLFLVHLTLFYEESLVKRFEGLARKLAEQIEQLSLDFDKASPEELHKIVTNFNKGRLKIFDEVARYLHINTFLYGTEQAFYKAVSADRYLEGRLERWDRFIQELSNVVSGAHELARQRVDRRTNKILYSIAVFGVFQVLFAATQSVHNWNFSDSPRYFLSTNILEFALVVASTIFITVKVFEYRRMSRKDN
jgi:hypothetical protein